MADAPIIIRHNFTPDDFMWLWAKYAVGFNERYHCTNYLRGPYSRRFSKARNPNLATDREITFDEHNGHHAIYICGVARVGYRSQNNYTHNVHIAIQPACGTSATYRFERWRVDVLNGNILPIPSSSELTITMQSLPPAFTSCRIFHWAARFAFPAQGTCISTDHRF